MTSRKTPTFQDIIFALQTYWSSKGCIVLQPLDTEKGAGTMNTHTTLRALGPSPWNTAYVEPCRRPTDGRYGENPNRLQHYFQFQVLMKPSPPDIQEFYVQSLEAIGILPSEHDIRFVEDNWESPTLGAWGLGWEVWLNGMEVSQFTYFQQCGGYDCNPVSVELTYGLERLAMFIQEKDNIMDIVWQSHNGKDITYRDIYYQFEVDHCHYNFSEASIDMCLSHFIQHEAEAKRLAKKNLTFPAYEHVLKCSHLFNLLDARGAISVTERQAYILRIRTLAKACATAFLTAHHPELMEEKKNG